LQPLVAGLAIFVFELVLQGADFRQQFVDILVHEA
jgi:hypothetical protein